ncbi:carboxypeptidase-like regulatory domain-containing protein [Winogradskyella luteola]|uniref:CarboxypepD_reg-like domain-containing protein n=1 Tax=Winogradskyella luteola TaxID=2828330 RepID=A0A9X1F9U4_9FLAO|nr:carboxypeptidase-like regulatory domain-containing protein [Winogradskyella luteola]MBV7269819.1 hypothetical protein [Winogradskyella luteola]
MKKTNLICGLVALLSVFLSQAQRKGLKGQLVADGDIEGIHILNKTALKYAISNEDGSFLIIAKTSDTLFISGLKYQSKEVIITQSMVNSGNFSVQLIEKINELDEVIVGKILTGSLESDLENSDAKTEVNFYDLGIPGNTNLPLTQNERKLFDADGGPSIISVSGGPFGGGLGVNFHKLLNKISGRTKKLQKIVELDDRDKCINRLRRDYEPIIFEKDTLAEDLRNEYFLFCQEDESFLALCKEKNEIKLLEYLKQKLTVYRENRKTEDKN